MGHLERMLKDQVLVRRFQSRDRAGDPSYAPAVPVAALIEQRVQLIINSDGNEQRASHIVAMDFDLDIRDRVWWADEDPRDLDLGKRPLAIRGAELHNGRNLREVAL